MKKQILLLFAILLVCLTGGCGEKASADKYVGEQITAMKKGDKNSFAVLLEEGIAESDTQYVLKFPEELKEPYLEFLQKAFNTIQFEVASAKKNGDDSFTVTITYSPLNISGTTKNARDNYLLSMTSSDLNAEVSGLLAQCADTLENEPVYLQETYTTITVDRTTDGFSISDEAMADFLAHVFDGYMLPYDSICELLDAQDYLKSYLDASFKGEVAQFALHTGMTEEEALAWYEGDFFDAPAELGAAYTDRYSAALKALLKQCQYTVGIPQKEDGIFNYTVDVSVTPNNSLININSELQSGTYYSEEEVDQAYVGLMEKYAAAPAYGESTVVTIPLNLDSLSKAGQEGSEITNLANIILPVE